MKLVFLVIWMVAGGGLLEIKPMPSMQVCERLGQEMGEWLESEGRGRYRLTPGVFTKRWTCIEIE